MNYLLNLELQVILFFFFITKILLQYIFFLLFSGTNQPFRAPIYGSYAEVWRGLSNQGFLGFYKGNFLGLAYTLCNSSVRFSTINMLDYSNYTFYHKGGSFIRGSVGNQQIIQFFLIQSQCSHPQTELE